MLVLHVTLVRDDLAASSVWLGARAVDRKAKPDSSISCRRQASLGCIMWVRHVKRNGNPGHNFDSQDAVRRMFADRRRLYWEFENRSRQSSNLFIEPTFLKAVDAGRGGSVVFDNGC